MSSRRYLFAVLATAALASPAAAQRSPAVHLLPHETPDVDVDVDVGPGWGDPEDMPPYDPPPDLHGGIRIPYAPIAPIPAPPPIEPEPEPEPIMVPPPPPPPPPPLADG